MKYLSRLLRSGMSAVLMFSIAASAFTQESRTQGEAKNDGGSRTGERASGILVEPTEDYRIGPRDVIEIKVKDAPELSDTFEVTAAGNITMEYLNRITVAGKTTDELARYLADRLRGNYLRDPQVSVTIKQYNSRSFFIMGAVNKPGVYQIESRASLVTLLILAGGLGANHGSTAYIFRRLKPEAAAALKAEAKTEEESAKIPEYEMFPANINGIFKGQIEGNVPLEPLDVVNVPQTDVFFVAGEVNAPGEFPLKPQTTLRQAISLARGFKFNAAKDRVIIFREDPKTGKREEVKVDVGAIMDAKKPDITLQPSDLIQVPNSKLKSFGGAVMNALGLGSVMRGTPVRY
ncbi:MAG TPA: polysaccharide biosynthesis/export family protein [Blastocatellia bacterium]|jgi:polysaccharide export outer membrane protein